MYLDLMDILRAPGTSLDRTIDLDPVDLEDVRFVERIRGNVRAANARRNIVVSGRAASEAEMRCSRCLRLFSQPLEMELEASAPVSFFRAAPNTVITNARHGGEDVEETDEDVDDETAAIFDAHSVDVLELLRQAAVLNWPIQPLCSADCAGLPEATRYEGPEGDDRWSALRALATNGESASPEAAANEVEADATEEDAAEAGWDEDISDDDLARSVGLLDDEDENPGEENPGQKSAG